MNQTLKSQHPNNPDNVHHPCFSHIYHSKIFRIHLPVALKCNIKCKFCDRKVGVHYHSTRPGVSKQIMSPKEALKLTDKYLLEEDYKEVVVGIAGPGEALYNKETFETLELINAKHPDAQLCVCTNGLLLTKYSRRLFNLGVKYITITINAVSPIIGKNIYSHINYNKKKIRGYEGAKILIENQITGVKQCSELGMLVKVNSVLIPKVNDFHIFEITKKIKEAGAYIHNVMPLIPLSELSHVQPPTCDLLRDVRNQCESILPQFRLCKQCRADACSIPGLE
ncbi:MAG: radical SAM protein [Candidatus Helarchaeota archaeon]|nr:radical SAM protein [Candidatus Helarchaeota archaeon]